MLSIRIDLSRTQSSRYNSIVRYIQGDDVAVNSYSKKDKDCSDPSGQETEPEGYA